MSSVVRGGIVARPFLARNPTLVMLVFARLRLHALGDKSYVSHLSISIVLSQMLGMSPAARAGTVARLFRVRRRPLAMPAYAESRLLLHRVQKVQVAMVKLPCAMLALLASALMEFVATRLATGGK